MKFSHHRNDTETERKEDIKREQKNISELWNKFKYSNIHVIVVLKLGRDRKLFEEMIAEKTPILIKTINSQIQKAQ